MRVEVNHFPELVQLARAVHHVPATEQQRVYRRVSQFSIGVDQKIVPENQGRTITKWCNTKCLPEYLFWKGNKDAAIYSITSNTRRDLGSLMRRVGGHVLL